MSVERKHTYAARGLIKMMQDDGEKPPPIAELERDFPRVLRELKERAPRHFKHRGVIDALRTSGDWVD